MFCESINFAKCPISPKYQNVFMSYENVSKLDETLRLQQKPGAISFLLRCRDMPHCLSLCRTSDFFMRTPEVPQQTRQYGIVIIASSSHKTARSIRCWAKIGATDQVDMWVRKNRWHKNREYNGGYIIKCFFLTLYFFGRRPYKYSSASFLPFNNVVYLVLIGT